MSHARALPWALPAPRIQRASDLAAVPPARVKGIWQSSPCKPLLSPASDEFRICLNHPPRPSHKVTYQRGSRCGRPRDLARASLGRVQQAPHWVCLWAAGPAPSKPARGRGRAHHPGARAPRPELAPGQTLRRLALCAARPCTAAPAPTRALAGAGPAQARPPHWLRTPRCFSVPYTPVNSHLLRLTLFPYWGLEMGRGVMSGLKSWSSPLSKQAINWHINSHGQTIWVIRTYPWGTVRASLVPFHEGLRRQTCARESARPDVRALVRCVPIVPVCPPACLATAFGLQSAAAARLKPAGSGGGNPPAEGLNYFARRGTRPRPHSAVGLGGKGPDPGWGAGWSQVAVQATMAPPRA